ncbi:RING finger protein 37 [Homalodisca vitripennis]|nr:RING finger protein 37 [Homalodisca vitripennis]
MQKSRIVDIISCDNLVTCVKCDKPSYDGYEVGNLIKNNATKKNNGFLAEQFVRPPIFITFDFNCNLRIHHIAIFCKVGAQKTSGIELLSSSNKGEYETIGSGVLSDSKDGFVFHRHDANIIGLNNFGEKYLYRTFKSTRHLSVSQSVKIKIFRTSGTSVPALGKVEIWGIPNKPIPINSNEVLAKNETSSGSNTQNLLNKDNSIPHTSLSVNSKPSWFRDINKSLRAQRTSNNSISGSYISSQPISIPEDFVDPITCEIMPQPLIMPSGKIIDNSTLETYQKAEERWGRGPNDPFTGVPFNEFRKPIVASDLKARIDKFLSDNSNHIELHNIPRTVGRNSSLISNHKVRANVSKLIGGQSSYDPINYTQADNLCENKSEPKRRKLEIDLCTQSLKEDGTHTVSGIDPSPGKVQPISVKNKITDKPKKVNNYQERMDQSLELALKSTLSRLPKLTADKRNPEKNTIVMCYNCNNCDNLFSIPCSHFVCRHCLISLKQQEFICSKCCLTFKSSDVQKVHL